MSNNWKKFIEATKSRQPIGFLVDIVKKGEVSGLALDLGCGAGADARYLAEKGFKVVAVDNNAEAISQAKQVCAGLDVEVVAADVTNFEIEPEKYSLIVSWNTLPFLQKEKAKEVLENIKRGLKKGGLFVFCVLGKKDEYSNKEKMSFWDLDEFEKFMAGMEIVELYEKRKQEPGATGEVKFWNSIRGVIRK
jgi:cyclopropane fatty-acyl-phospholipid synthase-like methyltransferase